MKPSGTANPKPSPSTLVRADRSILNLLALAAMISPVMAQQNLETAYRTTGSEVTAVFEAQRQILQTSSAVILDGRKEIAYGVVVSPDGYILTKASEVVSISKPAVTVDQTKYAEARVVLMDAEWDVALLKVDASGLVPVNFAPDGDVAEGTWVVANGATSRTTRRLLAGIVSAKSREIPPAGGAAMGVTFKPDSKELEIISINDKGGAKTAGLQVGDIVLSIGGKKVTKIEEVAESLKDLKAGKETKVTYKRKGQESSAQVRLVTHGELTGIENRNDQMSGEFSPRRSGFPRVMQTDLLGNRAFQGGPLLDLDGRCVGMNIARADRAESFAIPAPELRDIAARLMKQAGQQ